MLSPLWFSSIVWCVMENKGLTQVKDLPSTQYLREKGATLSQSYAMTSPSGPNYRLLTAGKVFTQEYLWRKPEPNIASVYAAIGLPSFLWYPKGKPALKHDPYKQLQPGITTWQKPFDPEQLPANCQVFLGYDPISNGHDPVQYPAVGAKQIDRTLMALIGTLDKSRWFNTPDANGKYPVFLMTYDESFMGDQHILTALYGRGVKAGHVTSKRYDHLSVCRTMTDNWHLPALGNAGKSPAIADVWVTSAKPTVRPTAAAAVH
ncbi:MAG: hypothetical protein H7338_21295 [Candidatus Sericytochromatia bacterium]|nr:hypothetical protein [Candidatus Sericytochromatia bacterium]